MYFLLIILSVVEAQLYPTLMQQRPVLLPSRLHQQLQVRDNSMLVGTVPVYEAVGPPQPPQMVGTSLVPPPTQTYVVRPGMPPALQTLPPFMGQSLPLGQQAYPYGDASEKRDGPLKRFLRGAADGFMLGAMGWIG